MQSHYRKVLYAFTILFIVSFNIHAQEKSDSNCDPLPKSERFKALGYELGTCKADVLKIIEMHGGKVESNNYWYDENTSIVFPPNITALKSDYIEATLPFKEDIILQPEISLGFYNNILIDIKVAFNYTSVNKTTSELKQLSDDVFKILESTISKRAGKGTIKKTKGRTPLSTYRIYEVWLKEGTAIVLSNEYLGKVDTVPAISLFEVSYKNDRLTKVAIEDTVTFRKESEQKEYQQQLEEVEGF